MKYLALTLIFFAMIAGSIQARAEDNEDFVTVLTEKNIQAFLEESRSLMGDMNFGADPEDITKFFQNHLAEKGTFRSKTRYELPGYPVQEGEMNLNKQEYLDFIAQGQGMLQDYSSSIEIKSLKIAKSGRSATLQTTTTEKGKLLWPDEDGSRKPLPIEGISECEQKLVVSLNNYIQIAQDDCATKISFAPFEGKPLGE
jgi:hypothetical protein